MSENEKQEEKDLDVIQLFAGAVYVGGVGVAVVLFISYILSAFGADQYATRAIMTIGVILVGSSSIALPLYIHAKCTDQKHRYTAIALYAGEILIMLLNVIVSFTFLQSVQPNSVITMPPWMLDYEPYSVVSIAYVVATWAILFSTDPAYKEKIRIKKARQKLEDLKARRVELEANREEKIFLKEQEYYDSIEGEDLVSEIATNRIRAEQKKYDTGPKHFGSRRLQPTRPMPLDVPGIDSPKE